MTTTETGWALSRAPQRHATTQIMGVTGMSMAVDDGWRTMHFELRDIEHASFDDEPDRHSVVIGLSQTMLQDLLRYDGCYCELRTQMHAVVTRRFLWLKHVSAETVTSVIPRCLLTVEPALSRCYVTAARTTTDIRGKRLPGVPAAGVLYYVDTPQGPMLPRILQAVHMRLPLWRLSWRKY